MILLLLCVVVHAAEDKLYFNANGEFKIAQFADCKYSAIV